MRVDKPRIAASLRSRGRDRSPCHTAAARGAPPHLRTPLLLYQHCARLGCARVSDELRFRRSTDGAGAEKITPWKV
jgi:hypothetical protein